MAKKSDGVIRHRIVLEGEKEYKKALTDISRAQRLSASELKANKAAYDENANAQENLTERLEILTRAHAQAEDKIKLMREQLTRVERAYGENSDEANGMRIAINNARAAAAKMATEAAGVRRQLDQMADAAEDAGDGLDELGAGSQGAGLDGIGKSADGLKEQLLGAATAAGGLSAAISAIKGGVSIAIDVSADTESADQTLAGLTGLYGDELEKIKESTEALYKTGLFATQTDAATAIAQVYQQTQLTGAALEEMTRYAQLFDGVFAIDVPESVSAANAMMQNFGIDAKTAYDLMAYGVQNGANKNGDLMDILAEYGPMFAQMGFSSDEFVAILVRGAQTGAYSVDKVGDAMKEFYLRMTGGNTDAEAALKALGLESADVMDKISKGGATGRAAFDLVITALEGVEDETLRSQLAMALFGTQAEDLGFGVTKIFGGVEGAAEDAEGAMERLNDVKMDDLAVQLTALGNKIKASLTDELRDAYGLLVGLAKEANNLFDADEAAGEELGVKPSEVGWDAFWWIMTGGKAGMGGYDALFELKDDVSTIQSSGKSFWSTVKSMFTGESPEKTSAQDAAEQSGSDTADGFVLGIEARLTSAQNAGIILGHTALAGFIRR